MTGNAEVRLDHARVLPYRTRSPSVAPSGDAAFPAAQITVCAANHLIADADGAALHLRDECAESHVDAEGDEVEPRVFGQTSGIARQNSRARPRGASRAPPPARSGESRAAANASRSSAAFPRARRLLDLRR